MAVHLGLDRVTKQLAHHLPPVTLLTGASEEERWELVNTLVEKHGVDDWDVLRVRRIDVAGAYDILQFSATFPVAVMKIAAINCDGASAPGLNRLLKVLEEPPLRIKFILLTDLPSHLPPTVRSRAMEYFILSPAASGPLKADLAGTSAKALIRSVVTADNLLFERIMASVKGDTAEQVRVQLLRMLIDYVSGIETDITDLPKEKALRMITSLSRVSEVSAKLALRVGLESFLRN